MHSNRLNLNIFWTANDFGLVSKAIETMTPFKIIKKINGFS